MNRRIPGRGPGFGARLAWLAVLSAGLAAAAASTSLAAANGSSATSPISVTPPLVSGQPQAGQVLAASSGSWSGSSPITFTYQWQRCDASGGGCADVGGATSQTYALASPDVGSTIRVAVTATNSAGSASARSPATSVVTPAGAPLDTAPPTISGEARQNETLDASPGSWQGTQPISFSYRWSRCDATGADCASIASASGQSYTLTSTDVGHTLRVSVTATNSVGSAGAISGPSAVVQTPGSAPASTSVPMISGSAVEGSTLSLSTGGWSGTAPLS
jgi:hypothetical protein